MREWGWLCYYTIYYRSVVGGHGHDYEHEVEGDEELQHERLDVGTAVCMHRHRGAQVLPAEHQPQHQARHRRGHRLHQHVRWDLRRACMCI